MPMGAEGHVGPIVLLANATRRENVSLVRQTAPWLVAFLLMPMDAEKIASLIVRVFVWAVYAYAHLIAY